MELCPVYRSPMGWLAGRFWRMLFIVRQISVRPASAAEPSKEAADQTAIRLQAAEILDRYGNHILRFAYSYVHNIDDAEDILQDTLIQFLKTAPVFASEQHKKAWLLRVAGNLSKNRLLYNRVRMADQLNETLTADGEQDLSFVWEAVKSLPTDLRETIHLYYYEGFSTKEIAAILGKNEATVRTHLRRGRGRLKEILQGEYDFDETV